METGQDRTPVGSVPAAGGRFQWRSLALWLPACLILGVPVAWAAVVAQGYFAPVVLFPLLVGVGLGALVVGLIRLGHVGNRPTVLMGTLLAVLVTVAGQHYVTYLTVCRWPRQEVKTRRHAGRELSELVDVRIPSFGEFMRREAARGRPPLTDYVARRTVAPTTWALWAVDGLLVLLATLAMVVPAVRLPFCNRCRSWYRVIRSGRIDAETAGRLSELADVHGECPPNSARYRLLACNGGCGPTDFQLCWRRPRGPALSARAWLDDECRDRMIRLLDEAKAVESGQ